MNTEQLIDTLSREGAAAPAARPWAIPLLASFAICLAILGVVLGAPLAALPEIGAAPYAMKLTFAVPIAIAGAAALRVAGTPGRPVARYLLVLAIPFAAVLALAAMEVAATGLEWPGRTWARCLAAIALLTPLAFGAAILALRRRAPTRLRLAGVLAGLFAGGTAATAYALWCPETSAAFLLSWYAAPIALAGAIGALLGPRLLRW
jgi:hypothetical protein